MWLDRTVHDAPASRLSFTQSLGVPVARITLTQRAIARSPERARSWRSDRGDPRRTLRPRGRHTRERDSAPHRVQRPLGRASATRSGDGVGAPMTSPTVGGRALDRIFHGSIDDARDARPVDGFARHDRIESSARATIPRTSIAAQDGVVRGPGFKLGVRPLDPLRRAGRSRRRGGPTDLLSRTSFSSSCRTATTRTGHAYGVLCASGVSARTLDGAAVCGRMRAFSPKRVRGMLVEAFDRRIEVRIARGNHCAEGVMRDTVVVPSSRRDGRSCGAIHARCTTNSKE